MHPLIKLGWSAAKGVSVGGVWLAAITLDENALIPIGSAIAVMGGVWLLSARLQRLEDGLKEMNRRIKVLEDR